LGCLLQRTLRARPMRPPAWYSMEPRQDCHMLRDRRGCRPVRIGQIAGKCGAMFLSQVRL